MLLLPAYELTMALGLLLLSTRGFAIVGLMIMHLILLLILGPFGLQHQPGVLIWNMFLLGQLPFLFGWRPASTKNPPNLGTTFCDSIGRQSAIGLTLLVLLFPLSVSIGVCDHWPAWEVYAPRTSRVTLEISKRDGNRLPIEMQEYFVEIPGQPGFQMVSLEDWSLDSLNVPIYPEERYQFAVAAALVRTHQLSNYRVSVGSVSQRWTGERSWQVADRMDELQMMADRFRLGTNPR